jgi:hypothetical protein
MYAKDLDETWYCESTKIFLGIYLLSKLKGTLPSYVSLHFVLFYVYALPSETPCCQRHKRKAWYRRDLQVIILRVERKHGADSLTRKLHVQFTLSVGAWFLFPFYWHWYWFSCPLNKKVDIVFGIIHSWKENGFKTRYNIKIIFSPLLQR